MKKQKFAPWKAKDAILEARRRIGINNKSCQRAFRKYNHAKTGFLDMDEFRGMLRGLNIEMEDDDFEKVKK